MSLTIRIPRKVGVAMAALTLLVSGGGAVAAVTTAPSAATCTANPAITLGATSESFSVTCSVPLPSPVTVTVTAPASTVTATPTTNASSSTASTTTTAPSPTSSTSNPTTPPVTTTTATLTTGPTPQPITGWPDVNNTGVPTGTTLTTYPGNGAIHLPSGAYDAKTFNGDLVIDSGQTVTISRSRINGRISSVQDSGHVTISDSRIDGGQQETFPAVGQTNISLARVEVVGGQHSVQCWANCSVTDSWLHGQYLPASSAGHVNAFISNGGSGFVLRHNTLDCTVAPTSAGGCTADLSLFGDFDPIANVTIDRNLFVAEHAGYCLQAGYNPGKKYPNATGVKVTSNTFKRVGRDTTQCGIWGPVTAYDPAAAGNQWTNNVWDTGGVVQP